MQKNSAASRRRLEGASAPISMGVVSTVGLLIALLADGWADVLSVALLAVPAALCIWLGYVKR